MERMNKYKALKESFKQYARNVTIMINDIHDRLLVLEHDVRVLKAWRNEKLDIEDIKKIVSGVSEHSDNNNTNPTSDTSGQNQKSEVSKDDKKPISDTSDISLGCEEEIK